MNALFWFFAIIFGIYLFFILFGRVLMNFGLRYLVKKAQENMNQQSDAYRDTFSSTPFEEKVTMKDGSEVVIPKEEKKKENLSKFGDSVEYEELK